MPRKLVHTRAAPWALWLRGRLLQTILCAINGLTKGEPRCADRLGVPPMRPAAQHSSTPKGQAQPTTRSTACIIMPYMRGCSSGRALQSAASLHAVFATPMPAAEPAGWVALAASCLPVLLLRLLLHAAGQLGAVLLVVLFVPAQSIKWNSETIKS